MNRSAAAAAVLFLSLAGLAEEPRLDPARDRREGQAGCRSVQWTPEAPSMDSRGFVRGLVPVDYDEDGKLDVAGLVGHWKLVWWKGAGDGTFAADAQTVDESGLGFNMMVADVTGDGRPDALFQGYPDMLRVMILPGTGSGRGSILEKKLVSPRRGGMRMELVQFDADPSAELILFDYRWVGIYDDIATSPRLVASFLTEIDFQAVAASDFDDDGHVDVAVLKTLADNVDVHFGKAGGAFEPPKTLPGNYAIELLLLGDLNEDGRPDLVATDWGASSYNAIAAVYLNQGERNFRRSEVPLAKLGRQTRIESILLADVSGDGHLDLAGSFVESRTGARRWIGTAVGRGDGTFLTPTFLTEETEAFRSTAAGDFDGDGKLDLAIGSGTALYAVTSTCATQIQLVSDSPMVLAGTDVTQRVQVSGFGPDTPVPPGTVILRDGSMPLDSAPIGEDGTASFVVPGLAVGDHPLTARFSGNATLPGATSAVATQSIAGEPTEVIVTLPDRQPVYGEKFPVQIQLTQLNDVDRYWEVLLYVDGPFRYVGRLNVPVQLSLEPGPHSIWASFSGTDLDPPGESAPMTFTVGKARTLLIMNGLRTLREGDVHSFAFAVQGSGAAGPTGSVQLIEGTTTIASGALVNGAVTLSAELPIGVHQVRAVYSGEARYEEATQNLRFEVLPNLPFPIEAHGTADGVRIAYVLPRKAVESTMVLFRRLAGTTEWSVVPGWNRVTGMDASVPMHGAEYEYRLLVSLDNAYRTFSNIDSATVPARRRAVSPP